jgi:hypothetical protein
MLERGAEPPFEEADIKVSRDGQMGFDSSTAYLPDCG